MQLIAPLIALSLFTFSAGEVREVALTAAVPEAGSARRTACTVTVELAGDTLEVEMNGSPVPAQFLPKLDFSMADERSLAVVDVHDADGWVRAYDEVEWTNAGSMEMDGGGSVESFPWSSNARTAIEGRKVRFERCADAATGFADGRDGDAAALEGLRVELGLAELLPSESMAIGDTWTVEGDALDVLFEPGGDLAYELDPEAASYLQREERSRAYTGSLTMRLASVEDGVARCEIEGEIARVTVHDGDLTQVPVVDGTATETVTATWEVAGTLDWLVDEHRPARLELAGALHEESVTLRDEDQPGPTYRSVFRADGERELRIVCEALDADKAR